MKVGKNTLSVVLRHCMCAGVGEWMGGRGGKGGRERGKERQRGEGREGEREGEGGGGKGGRERGEGESCLRQMNSHTITDHRLKRSF